MRTLLLLVFCAVCLAQADSRVPSEVRYKSGYVNSVPKPPDFTSAMLWGIAIGDTRVAGYQHAKIEIARTTLTYRVDGRDVTMNDDAGNVRGGLYQRFPWFGTDSHNPMPLAYSADHHAVILNVGQRTDHVWHFWAASPRRSLPSGHLEGCTVTVRARISKGALQIGFDYWRNPTIGYGSGGNNHEAGAGGWYFSLDGLAGSELYRHFSKIISLRVSVPPVVKYFCLVKWFQMEFTEQFDIVVVGPGHAGCEVEAHARRLSRAPKSRAERGTWPSCRYLS